MIPYEEFYYGLTNGSIKLKFTNPEAKKMLKQRSLEYLTSYQLQRQEHERWERQYLPTEDLLTFTHLYRSQDSYGRPIENNHTIIVKVQDYLNAYPPSMSIVQQLFNKDEVILNV